MKKTLIALVGILLTMAISCKKHNNDNPPLHESPSVVDDARAVLLKDVVAMSLPSPYFHFVYNNLHYVTQINFASGFFIYNVEYENKRVKKMTNTRSSTRNFFLYSYSDSLVSEINEFSGLTGNKIRRYRFFYDSHQLTQVLWLELSPGNTGILYKKSVLSYHPDGNLATIEHYGIVQDLLTLLKKDVFSDYDNKTNVDDFHLLKEFFDAYFFLPQVKLQKNNPLRQNIFGVDTDFDISYTYGYQNNLPVQRTGIVTQTRGNETGKTIHITNLYNYY